MKKRIVHFLIALFILTTIWKCATITTPQGGPKDDTPPTLLKSNPKQNQKNFDGAEVELTFNEPIKLKDAREQILITPSPGKETNFIVKENVLTIRPKNPWNDSTTYSISFREGVQDLSEGNTVPNLRLAFSTGPTLDSLIVQGTIKDAITEKIPENITVALYSTDTFNIFKHTPSFFTKTGKDGVFKLENLKPDNYLIYAFDDKNKNLKVDSPAEMLGFLSDTLYLIKNIEGLSIPLLKIDARELKLTSGRSIQDVATIKFNKAVTSYRIEEEENAKLVNAFGDDQTQITIYINQNVKDSIKIRVYAQDSLAQKADTSFFIKRTATKRQPDPFRISFTDVELDSLAGELRATFKSNKIIDQFNFDSISLRIDSAQLARLNKKDIHFDSIFKKGMLLKKIDRSLITSDRKKLYKLELGKNYASSVENDSIKAQNIPVKLLTFEETGTLSIELKNNTDYDLILELITPVGKLVRSVANPKKFVFQNLTPDTYKLRVIHDKNRNGKWDYGNILLREEPEDISFYKTIDNKYDFPIRANWEVGPFKLVIDKPTGKPKDEKPPLLLKSNPSQNQTNFKQSVIKLQFDEPVQLENPKDEIIITPSPGETTTMSKDKSITLEPKSGWKESTTYSIAFRDAIQDQRGGNTASDINLTFSTGKTIDSLTINGNIKSALSLKTQENATIGLYTSDTFNIFKHRPLYFTKSTKDGKFKLDNLKPGNYFIYAFDDKNKNLKVESEKEAYGFLVQKVNLDKNIENLTIPIYLIDTRKPKLISTKSIDDQTSLQFNKRLTTYTIKNKSNTKLNHSFGNDRSQILIYSNQKVNDSLKIQFQSIDSLNQKLDTSIFIKRTPIKRKPETFTITANQAELDSTSGEINIQLTYNKKINLLNQGAVSIVLPTNQIIPFDQKDIETDTLSKKITLSKKLDPTKIPTNKKTPVKLSIQKSFIISIEGDSTKPQKIPLTLINTKKDGSISIEVINSSGKKFIIELLNTQNKTVEAIANKSAHTFKNLPANSYKIRITIDENNNGKWDFGNILLRQEPEKSFFYETPGKKFTIEIKDKPDPKTYQITI